jgi:hypothetical protein
LFIAWNRILRAISFCFGAGVGEGRVCFRARKRNFGTMRSRLKKKKKRGRTCKKGGNRNRRQMKAGMEEKRRGRMEKKIKRGMIKASMK